MKYFFVLMEKINAPLQLLSSYVLLLLALPFGAQAQSVGVFTNTQKITIPDVGPATPYPAALVVSGQRPYLTDLRVDFKNVFHGGGLGDVDVLLEAPNGQKIMLFSDVLEGQGAFVLLNNLVFDTQSGLPLDADHVNGNTFFHPTNEGTNPDTFPAPGPGVFVRSARSLLALDGINPNGVWKLWVVSDRQNGLEGSLGYENLPDNFGWQLTVFSADTKPCERPDWPVLEVLEDSFVQIGWETPLGQSAWDVFYTAEPGLSPTAATPPTIAGIASHQQVLVDQLMHNTRYKLWIRGRCGNGASSAWVGPLPFRTKIYPCRQPVRIRECEQYQLSGFPFFTRWKPDVFSTSSYDGPARILEFTPRFSTTYRLHLGGDIAYKTAGTCDTVGWTTLWPTNPWAEVALQAGTTYWFYVEQEGLAFIESCVWPPLSQPTLTPVAVTPTRATFRWAEAFNPNGIPGQWDVYLAPANAPGPDIGTVPTVEDVQRAADGAFKLIHGLPAGSSNQVFIRPRCDDARGCWSAPTDFQVPVPSVAEVKLVVDTIWHTEPGKVTCRFRLEANPAQPVNGWLLSWGHAPYPDADRAAPVTTGPGNPATLTAGDFDADSLYDIWVRPVPASNAPAYAVQEWFGPFQVKMPEPCVETSFYQLQCGQVQQGQTQGANNFAPPALCGTPQQTNLGETVGVFNAYQTGEVEIRLSGANGPPGAVIAVYVKKISDGCGLSGWAHLGCWEMGQVQEALHFAATKGVAYYVLFDARGDANFEYHFTLEQCVAACAPPKQFQVLYTEANAVTLGWLNDVPGQTYRLDYDFAAQSSAFNAAAPKIPALTGQQIVINGLLKDTAYDFHLQRVCDNGFQSEPVKLTQVLTGVDHPVYLSSAVQLCNPRSQAPLGSPAKQYGYELTPFVAPSSGTYYLRYKGSDDLLAVYENAFVENEPFRNLVALGDTLWQNFAAYRAIGLSLEAGKRYWLVQFARQIQGFTEGHLRGPDYVQLGDPVFRFRSAQPHGRIWKADGTVFSGYYTCLDTAGWYHFYVHESGDYPDLDKHYLLFSTERFLPAAGQVYLPPGQTGGMGGAVKIENPPALYATNPSGWYVMNRYWNLFLPLWQQPTHPIKLRYYYLDADFEAIRQAVVAQGNPPPATHEQLYFYKINDFYGQNGPLYNADPASGHIGIPKAVAYDADGYWEYRHGASATASTWHHGLYKNGHFAEMLIHHFSGGGGGIGADLSGATALTAVPVLSVPNCRIYPNPTTAQLFIDGLATNSWAKIRVLDLLGRTLWQQDYQAGAAIEVEALPAGTFMVVLECEQGRAVWKVVKQ